MIDFLARPLAAVERNLMQRLRRIALGGVLAVLVLVAVAALPRDDKANNEIPFPKDYRHWNHAKTMILEPGHPLASPFEGLHNIYVNEKGLEAHKKGTAFPDGSMLVFDLFEVSKADEAIVTAKRKFVAVMLKDSATYKETGGWGFERFDARFKPTHADGKGCFQCHVANDSSDWVFSRFGD